MHQSHIHHQNSAEISKLFNQSYRKYNVKTRKNVVAVSIMYSSCLVQYSIPMNLQIVDCKNQILEMSSLPSSYLENSKVLLPNPSKRCLL
jgi:hypothetical protein